GNTATVARTLTVGDYSYFLSVADSYLLFNSPSLVKIHVSLAPNAAPTADSQTVTTDEDTSATIPLTASDPDSDALTYQIVSPPKHGVLLGNAPVLYYVPDNDYNGTDSFTFTV